MSTRSRIRKDNMWRCAAGVPVLGRKPLVAVIWAALVLMPMGGCVMDQGDGGDGANGSVSQALLGGSAAYTQAVRIADPHRARLPDNSPPHNFGRAIWDMHNYDGRIFIGGGNFYSNTGRTDIWTYRVSGGQPVLEVEFTVDDEAVLMFHEYDGELLVPGIDSTESWELGNFYTRSSAGWTKHRTVPDGVHVYDNWRPEADFVVPAPPFSFEMLDGTFYVGLGTEGWFTDCDDVESGSIWRIE